MREIEVGLGDRRYAIRIDSGWAGMLGREARAVLPKCDRVLVVTNPEIGRLHGGTVRQSLEAGGFPVDLLELPEGEANKTVAVVEKIWDRLIRGRFTRQSALVALGGGVIGDMTGFAAASYMRGIDFIQVPTSLLAMVDSSVGGKTGVNHPLAKNVIGAFWQPRLVFMELEFLRTLPVEELRSGFAEVIKHGVIRDAEYFAFLEERLEEIFALDGAAMARVVEGSCRIKADVVAADEREAGLRAILNFGHTIGHAVEALARYGKVRHGEAVGMGMIAATRLGEAMGVTDPALLPRLTRLLERSGLPTRLPALAAEDCLEKIKTDKKTRDGRARFVLPVRLGETTIRDDAPRDAIRRALVETGATE